MQKYLDVCILIDEIQEALETREAASEHLYVHAGQNGCHMQIVFECKVVTHARMLMGLEVLTRQYTPLSLQCA